MDLRCWPAALTVAALVVGSAGGARAQEEINYLWPVNLADQCWIDHGQAGGLAAVLALQEMEDKSHASEDAHGIYLDVLGTQWALCGEEQRALAAGDEAYGAAMKPPPMAEGTDPLAGLHPVDALPALIAAARDRRIVMVNEEHRSSVQRAFTNRLLQPLHELGFRYLAVEALSEEGPKLKARGYPALSSGSYLRDPVFGDLVRRALALGFVVVPYEATPGEFRSRSEDEPLVERQNRRERGQATHLFERTIGRDPEARVLVVAGRDHIAEAEGGGWVPMGAALREISGLDPLTVNQIAMTEHSRPELERWEYRAADAKGWLAGEPVLLVDEAGAPWSAAPGVLDISLVHPRTRQAHGRPQWMAMGGLRKPVDVKVPAHDRPLLLVASLQGESAEAVPVDRVILWPGQPAPSLMLRPAAYVIVTLDRSGKELSREERRVE